MSRIDPPGSDASCLPQWHRQLHSAIWSQNIIRPLIAITSETKGPLVTTSAASVSPDELGHSKIYLDETYTERVKITLSANSHAALVGGKAQHSGG